jgi:HEPN domain-containing protein
MSQDRDTFRRLAELRLTEAELLYANGLASGAYYLAGYAVECALKAVIAAGFRANEIPDKSRVNNIYTHNLKDLLNLAGLKSSLENDMNEVSELRENWATISSGRSTRGTRFGHRTPRRRCSRRLGPTRDCCNGY